MTINEAFLNEKHEQQKSVFNEFRLAKYCITIKALEPMILPGFKGSMLRGGFGHVFRRICCASREETCYGCLLRQSCPYAYVFETAPPEDTAYFKSHQKVPRPYVFETPLDNRVEYNTGDELVFHLTLIGRGIGYLPYFIFAIRELGEIGITIRRHKFKLSEIYAVDCLTNEERLVFSPRDNLVHNEQLPLIGSMIMEKIKNNNVSQLTLNFLTPTRVKYQGNYCFNSLSMAAVIQNLTIRLNALSYFHCAGWDDDLKSFRDLAYNVHTCESTIRKMNVLRYSNRQGKKDSLSGIIGKITYWGELRPLLPILILGQFIHVGSDAVFGCGKYEVLDII